MVGGVLLGSPVTPAGAVYGPGAEPASAVGSLLSDERNDGPLISGDGRYVVFRSLSAVLIGTPPNPDERYSGGIVRRDLRTGEVALVAPPRRVLRADGKPVEGDVGTDAVPSGISEDGRYVLFGSTARLSANDPTGQSPDVYVRDMRGPLSGQSSYELVSARDGSVQGAGYADVAAGALPGLPGYALSADGRRAVFVTTGTSDLPARGDETTPPRQVWVRDLDARTTRLVSRAKDDGSPDGTPSPVDASASPQVAISGDGTKAVWSTGDAQRQTRTLPGEPAFGSAQSLVWRDLDRITAPSRRVAGAADLDDPGCAPTTAFVPSETATGPCYGPFTAPEGLDANGQSLPPKLAGISRDGGRVLFSSSTPLRPLDRNAVRPGSAYLADMTTGVPRKHAVTLVWSYPNLASRYSLDGGWLSADGRYALFSSRDHQFDGFQPVGSFPSGELLTFNVYLADLQARTVERVTSGYDGSDYSTGLVIQSAPVDLTASADLSQVGFSAADGNLFLGDANGVTDVMVVGRRRTSDLDVSGRVLPAPAPPSADGTGPVTPLGSRFVVTLGPVRVSKRTGTASVRVSLPAAGTLVGTAKGTAKPNRKRTAKKARSGTGTAVAERRSSTRTVAVGRSSRKVARAGTVTVRIPVGSAARKLLRRSTTSLAVRLDLRFSPRDAAPTTTTRAYVVRRSDVQARTTTKTTPRKPRATPRTATTGAPR